jgi:hypothetical protein
MSFLLILQEVRPIGKTRNQLEDKAGRLNGGSVTIASGKYLLLPGDTIIPNNLTMACSTLNWEPL